MKLVFSREALRQYDSWIDDNDVKTLDRIDALLESILETPFSGIGKPEPLKHEFSGTWSRRINKRDRIRYRVKGDVVEIVSCRDHY